MFNFFSDKKEKEDLHYVMRSLESNLQNYFLEMKPSQLYEPISYQLLSGGKRLRPLLCFIVARSLFFKYEDVFHLALSSEMIHNFSLIHDDVVDKSLLRRGKETVPVRFGNDLAIFSGDSLLAFSYLELLKNCNEKNTKTILQLFTENCVSACEGQALDILYDANHLMTRIEYLVMIEKKTSSFLAMFCAISAMLCNATSQEVKAITLYGKNIGIAFQIQDDYLDFFGEESDFGKEKYGDLLHHKKNYLFLMAVENKINRYEELIHIYNKKTITKDNIMECVAIYKNSNLEYLIKKDIEYYYSLALSELSFFKNNSGKKMLKELVDFLSERKK